MMVTSQSLLTIVIPQRKIPARDWSKSRHVTLTIRTVARALLPGQH